VLRNAGGAERQLLRTLALLSPGLSPDLGCECSSDTPLPRSAQREHPRDCERSTAAQKKRGLATAVRSAALLLPGKGAVKRYRRVSIEAAVVWGSRTGCWTSSNSSDSFR
jgi:hypothetical protein